MKKKYINPVITVYEWDACEQFLAYSLGQEDTPINIDFVDGYYEVDEGKYDPE